MRLARNTIYCTDGTLRTFLPSHLTRLARRHVALRPCNSHIVLQSTLGQHIAALAAAPERNYACKALLERAREYIRSFLNHGVRRRRSEHDEPHEGSADVVASPCVLLSTVDTSSLFEGNIVDESRQRRDAADRLVADADAQAMRCAPSVATPHPAVVRSFRDAVRITTAADEILRAAALQHEANSRLRQHHEDTVRRGHVIVTTVDANTTLVRVATSDLELDLDKSSVSKKTLPKLINRRLNTLLTPKQRSPGSVVIVSEADTNSVIAIWLPGSLHSHHRAARDLARIRHYVSGGWAKGCAAEPVASPERLAVLWNNMLRLRAYGLNEFCTFLRVEPCGTSYRLIYRNRYGRETGFQMGAWIDRAQLSRADLLCESEYAIYDAELHEAYRRGVTAALDFEGVLSPEDVRKRVSKLHLGLLASNFLDSRMR